MKSNLIILLFAFFCSCKTVKTSEIEVIKFDMQSIQQEIDAADTTYTQFIGRKDQYEVVYFENRKNDTGLMLYKDSLGNVRGVCHQKSFALVSAVEYYPNGQAMGKLPEKINGKYEGPARYYYEDGRVKSEGLFKNNLWAGEWKNYDENGKLISIDDYGDGNIQFLKRTEVHD